MKKSGQSEGWPLECLNLLFLATDKLFQKVNAERIRRGDLRIDGYLEEAHDFFFRGKFRTEGGTANLLGVRLHSRGIIFIKFITKVLLPGPITAKYNRLP